jgi:hypothetical protein
MGEIYDGSGSSIAFATTGVSFKVEKFEAGPADKKKEIDVTTLANASVRTKKLSILRELENLSVTIQHDPAKQYATWAANELITISFPSGSGSLAFYGGKMEYKPNELEAQNKTLATVTIMISNLNGSGVETAPVYTA